MIRMYLFIVIVGTLMLHFTPWWFVAPVCFAVCCCKARSCRAALLASTVGGMSIWLGYIVYLNSQASSDLITARVVGVFLPESMRHALPDKIAMAAFAGAIVGVVCGFSGLAGVQFQEYLRHRQQPIR